MKQTLSQGKTPFLRVTLAAALLAVTGCTSVSKGLVGETRENVAPFAEASIEALAVEIVGLRKSELVYLRTYAEEDSPELDALRDVFERIDRFTDGLSLYSLELLRVAETPGGDEVRAMAYADMLATGYNREFLGQLGVTPESIDARLVSARNAPTLLSAIREFQPVIVQASNSFDELIDEALNEDLANARAMFDRRIREEFAVELETIFMVYRRRDELMNALLAIDAYRRGDRAAIEPLQSGGAIRLDSAQLSASPDEQELRRTTEFIMAELDENQRLVDLLATDIADYEASVAELERELSGLREDLVAARTTISLWVRAHQAMASGISDAGRWLKPLLIIAKRIK